MLSDSVEIGKTGLAIIGHVLGFKILPAKRDIQRANENWAEVPLVAGV